MSNNNSNSNSSHWCKGVLEEIQSKSQPASSSSSMTSIGGYYPVYPNNNNNTNNNGIISSSSTTTTTTSNSSNIPSNDYYRQYCDYYSRFYYGQLQSTTSATTTSTNTATITPSNNLSSYQLPSTASLQQPPIPVTTQPPPPVTPPPPVPPPTPYNSSIPSQITHQMPYTSAPPVTYASALLKGQSNWTTPSPPLPPPIVNQYQQQQHHYYQQQHLQQSRVSPNINSTSWPTPAQTYQKPNPNRFILPNQNSVSLSQSPQISPSQISPSTSTSMLTQTQQSNIYSQYHQTNNLPVTNSSNSNPEPSPWPKSLKLFVEKSFSQCDTDSDRTYVEEQLKLLITKVTNDGRLHQHKWELESIPLPPSLQSKIPSLSSNSSSYSTTSNYSYPNSTLTNTTNTGNGTINLKDEIKEPKRKKSRFQPIDTSSISSQNINLSLPSSQSSSSTTTTTTTTSTTAISTIPSSKQSNPIISAPLSTKEELNRQNRANRFIREHSLDQKNKGDKKEKKNSKYSKNIVSNPKNTTTINTNTNTTVGSIGLTEFDLESLVVVGTCQKIEKDYLRLTSAPDPSTVRPLEVLKQALNLVTEKWNQSRQNRENISVSENIINSDLIGNNKINSNNTTSYVWICSQLKSIRQDVMIQHIKNDFTISVYEFHGRVALQSGDLNEYNQCQTQLKQLYSSGLKGSEMEFTAYRILYYLYLQGNIKYQKGSQDIAHLMSTLTNDALSDPSVQHALKLRKAIALENYHQIFHLYQITPNYGKCILDKMLDTWRVKALQKMAKAYRPDLEINFILNELGFNTSSTHSTQLIESSTSSQTIPISTKISNGIEFITRVGGIITSTPEGEKILDTKLSSISTSSVVAQDDQLLL